MAEGDASKRGRDAVVGLVIDQLSEERSRKASIEQRALSAITSSGALVTLLLGAAALVTRRSDFAIPSAAAIWASVAIGSFVATAAIAIFALMPRTYADVSSEALDRLVGDETWERSSDYAALEAARLRVDVIATARANNAVKARTLTAALACQVIAVLCLAIAAILILETRYKSNGPLAGITNARRSQRESNKRLRTSISRRSKNRASSLAVDVKAPT